MNCLTWDWCRRSLESGVKLPVSRLGREFTIINFFGSRTVSGCGSRFRDDVHMRNLALALAHFAGYNRIICSATSPGRVQSSIHSDVSEPLGTRTLHKICQSTAFIVSIIPFRLSVLYFRLQRSKQFPRKSFVLSESLLVQPSAHSSLQWHRVAWPLTNLVFSVAGAQAVRNKLVDTFLYCTKLPGFPGGPQASRDRRNA